VEDLLAIDEQRLTAAAVAHAVREEVRQAAEPLRAGIRLVRREALSPGLEAVLKEAGVLQPVFRAQEAIMVALPEVRIEESRSTRKDRLEEWIKSHSEQALVRSQGQGRIVLEPVSGHGEDALAMANALTEEVEPEVAQARFLRVLPRPSTLK
jgi:hypothetical protein